jgi:hypothetical protein
MISRGIRARAREIGALRAVALPSYPSSTRCHSRIVGNRNHTRFDREGWSGRGLIVLLGEDAEAYFDPTQG